MEGRDETLISPTPCDKNKSMINQVFPRFYMLGTYMEIVWFVEGSKRMCVAIKYRHIEKMK